MQVRWIPEQGAFANSYIFGTVLVDAGLLPMAIREYRDGIDTIVLTHCHFDHIAHVKEIAHMCKAKVAIHRDDAVGLIEDARSLSMHFGARSPGIVPDIKLNDGDTIGGLKVIHTPGHTPGSICLWSEADKVLISGDTVFTDGAFGRYDFPGGSRQALERSLDQLGQLDVEGLYPGHGEPVDCGGKRHIAAARQLMKAGYG
ncbi:MAG: MBL fold metallo-hydrolase [Methanoregula sp.]|uniref:MBL fold metallo-hydrolase n=1 Tax=Methanoregula sp. TaxID=2052170 RepID=UPI003BB07D99